MKRTILIGLVLCIGALVYGVLQPKSGTLALVGAKAFPAGDLPGMFMVTLKIENGGAPDELFGVSSARAKMVTLMNPSHPGEALIVPGQSEGQLAMDGAHLMLQTQNADFAEGAFIPLTLNFKNAGDVSTRVLRVSAPEMSHDPTSGVSETPTPQLELMLIDTADQDGFAVSLSVENFTFIRKEDDARHVPNQGHAHIYLNGLKLGRLYEPTFRSGALVAGSYQLEVALNTNDHRPYLDKGQAVRTALSIEIP